MKPTRLRVPGLAVALVVLVGAPDAARAQTSSATPSSDNRAVAEMLFFAARGLMEAGRYPEACVKFAESYRIDPAAGTLLNLAFCHEKEGKVASAWGEYRQALVEARKANRADREELAREHIATLEPQLPMLTIEVPETMRVKGLEVLRNGVVLQSGGWGVELPTDPGKVEIIARAPGYRPKTKFVSLEKAQHASVRLEALEELPPEERPQPMAAAGWGTKKVVGASLVGLGVVGLAVGTGLGIHALALRDKSNDLCPELDGERRCSAEGAQAMDEANAFAWGTNIAIGTGIIAAGVGTYLFITGGDRAAESDAPAAARIRWSVTPTYGGAAGFVTGAF